MSGREATVRAGRPSAERVEAIERAILDAGRHHFRTAGFGPKAMETIAATAEVSKSTLYARYPTKESLLRAIVVEQTRVWTDARLQQIGTEPEDGKAKLHAYARAMMFSLCSLEIRQFTEMLCRTGDPDGDLIRTINEVSYYPTIDEFTRTLSQAARDFTVPPRSARRVAEMLAAMLTGWHFVQSRTGPVALEDAIIFADHTVDVLYAGRSAW